MTAAPPQMLLAHHLKSKRSVKDACHGSPSGAMIEHGNDSNGSVRYADSGH